MISSFWNLCRACPSMPVEKQLHSEYRSTFQWHEYVGSRADPSSLSQRQHQPQQEQPQQNQHQLAVVRQPHRSTQSQVLWASAAKAVVEESSKRKRHPDILNRTSNGWTTKSTADEIRSVQLREQKQADPAGAGGGPRKSISMGTIRATENVPVHSQQKLSNLTSIANAGISQPSLEHRVPLDSNKETDTFEWTDREPKHDNTNMHFSNDVDDGRGRDPQRLANREYLSEYKKRFRPFSQYEYVDGKFFKKKGDQEITSPWFNEVIELRKKAGEYRHRGWGTELAPQHMAEVYNQQLWDQVSRRSSLAALALITTTTQRLSKEEKEKENVKRSHPPRSSSRPHTATPKHPLSDLRVDKQKDTEAVQKKKPLDGATAAVNRAARAKARSQSAGPGGRSPRKSARQIVSSYGKPKEGPGGPGWKVQSDSGLVNSQAKPMQRHPRPTTLATSPRPKASSDKGHRDLNSKSVKQLQFDKSSADPSLGCYEPVVKSPPEPTRVKSPEQAILMSPDPVNWTVPLDTSKSFTVTQNIREAPPSPRFRSGERFHGDGRSIRHPLSGQHSSAGSTMASSPISARSAPVPIHSVGGGGAAPTGLSSSAPGHNTIMERGSSSSRSSSVKEPTTSKPKDYVMGLGRGGVGGHHSDGASVNERDHGTGGGASGGGGLARKSSIEIKPHIRSKQPMCGAAVNGVDSDKKRSSTTSLLHQDKRQVSLEKASEKSSSLKQEPSLASSLPGESRKSSASTTASTKSVLPSSSRKSETESGKGSHSASSIPKTGTEAGKSGQSASSIPRTGTETGKGSQSSSFIPKTVTSTAITNSSTTATTTATTTSAVPCMTTTTNATTTTTTVSSSPSNSSATGARSESCAKIVPGTTLRCLEDPTFMFDPPEKSASPPPTGLRRFSSSSVSTSVPPSTKVTDSSSSTAAGSGVGGGRYQPSHHTSIPTGSKSTSIPTRSSIRVLEAPDTAPLRKHSSPAPLPSSSSRSMTGHGHIPSGIPTHSSSSFSSSNIDFIPPAPVASTKRQGLEAYQVSNTPPPHTKRSTYRVLDAPDDASLYGALPSPGQGRSRASEVLDKARNRFDKFWGKKEDEK